MTATRRLAAILATDDAKVRNSDIDREGLLSTQFTHRRIVRRQAPVDLERTFTAASTDDGQQGGQCSKRQNCRGRQLGYLSSHTSSMRQPL